MRYRHKISQEELEKAFGDLLEIATGYDDEKYEESEFKSLTRKGQDFNKIYQVTITTPNQAIILLDYLSYDKSTWDYEPKLCVSMFGTIINFQRRGNMGHLDQLELGDMFIVDSWIKEQYAERYLPCIPKGDKNLREGYYALLKANELAEQKLSIWEEEITKLRKEISILKNTDKKIDLPF
jgi:hypothetical protein